MRQRGCLVWVGLAAFVFWSGSGDSVAADSLTSAIFVRADSDHTVVVSPRAHLEYKPQPELQADFTYAADIWTSASVDVRAMATVPITEQRDELDLGVSYTWQDASVAGGYRYSVENDYESHGVNASGSLDLAQHNTRIAVAGYAFMDTVGRSGQPAFARDLLTLGARATLTQVLDEQSLLQLTYEPGRLLGYQASPYRFVGVGGTGFGCQGANECLPEHVPAVRNRHALALLARRALSDTVAASLSYRFYLDDWQLRSHTLAAELSWMPYARTRLLLGYRFYTQTGVYFYLPVYTRNLGRAGYTTRDREQSPMHDQRLGVEWIQSLALYDAGGELRFHTSLAGLFFNYANFRGLDIVRAVELTLAISVER
jgi:hypothetical protein